MEDAPEIKNLKVLEEIRENTRPVWWRFLLNGALTGAGMVTGTVIAIVLLAWLLSFFGIIPGLEQIAKQMNEVLRTRYY